MLGLELQAVVLEASAASVDVTPRVPVPLSGYRARTAAFTHVHDRLEIDGVLLRQGAATLVLLSADVLFVTDQLRADAEQYLTRKHGIQGSRVLLGATHTHFAPALDHSKPLLGGVDQGYLELWKRRLFQLLDRLIERPRQAELQYTRASTQPAANRRRWSWSLSSRARLPMRTVAMQPNPRGISSSTIHAMVLREETGRIMAVLWSYACHPTAFHRTTEISADFPGVVRRHLRERVANPELCVLYFQGFAGNLRPPSWMSPEGGFRHDLLRLAKGPRFGLFSPSEYSRWTNSLAADVEAAALGDTHRRVVPRLAFCQREIPLSELISGGSDGALRITKCSLADNICLVGLSAEVVVEYVTHLEGLFSDQTVIPISCLDSVFGYLPTNRMIKEGGYEAGGFFRSFSLTGQFNSDAETIVLDRLRELARIE